MSTCPARPALTHAVMPSSPIGDGSAPGLLASMVADRATQILVACGLLGFALIVLALGLWYYRRHWVHDVKAGTAPWTFEEIRAMRDRGDVTEAEYQALRAQLIGLASGTSEPSKAVKPGNVDPSGETVWSFDLKKTPPG